MIQERELPAHLRSIEAALLKVKSQQTISHRIGGIERAIAVPVTFTPFASVRACTARCQFCSEALIHKEATALSASLRPGREYHRQLREVLHELLDLEVGLSLSGLEGTSSAAWLLDVIEAARQHERMGGSFGEKVLYSNGTGFAVESNAHEILRALSGLELTRIEMSRHSSDQKKNDAIMRFRDGIAVRDITAFEKAVRLALTYVPVKLVCVIQKGGVESLADAERYLSWASQLGVDSVVFRELSRLHDLYRPNLASRYVESARIAIEPLVDAARQSHRTFQPVEITDGYYYWNVKFRCNKIFATFETSDYLAMKRLHRSGVIYKLIFHANGNLCADWDPGTQVLMRTASIQSK